MIGTIRKHSAWLWFVIIGLTIISFLWWGASPVTRNGGGRLAGDYGKIYGREILPEDYAMARNELLISYWQQTGQWPDKTPGFDRTELEKQIYVRLLLAQKAKDLGIQVSDDAVVAGANQILASLGRGGQPVLMADFYQRVLQPEGLTIADFQRSIRSYLAIQQLVQALGLPGALVTPQDAAALYDREYREVSAQAVFFSASNYVGQVSVTPTAVADFYTKNQANYREPDRVQVNYIKYDLTNYFAAVEQKIGKTNLDVQAEGYYRERGSELAPEAKTAAEAKAKIRDLLVREHAFEQAGELARDFATTLFAMEPVKPENLAVVAKQKGLTVHTTAPFSAAMGPEDFSAPQSFVKSAFQLNPEQPFSEVIGGPDAIYILALNSRLPSSIPPLETIRERVSKDFQRQAAVALAQAAGTNFHNTVTLQLATGKTFTQAAVAAGHAPLALTPFSLNSSIVPEAGDHADIGQLKQAAFTTTTNHASQFVATMDGGFVLFVNGFAPVNVAKKNSELPQFTAQVRRARENEAFNLWLQAEANRELRETAFFEKQEQAAAAQKSP